jgi:hypothetical protein
MLAAAIIVAWTMVAPVAYEISGLPGLVAATAGAGACLLSAEFALVVGALFHGPLATLYRIAIGMVVRTMFPLVVCVALYLTVPVLAEAGIVFYLLFFYLTTLATETVLLIAQVPRHANSKPAI